MAARRKKTGSKMNIPLCLACVLLCLTLFSFHFSGGVVARYSTTASSGDSARVIQFGDLTLTETVPQPYMAPGAALGWNAAVSFTGSESATYVFVEVAGVHAGDADGITPFANGPKWMVNQTLWTYLDVYDGSYVYYRALAPNVTLNENLFANDSATVSENLTAVQIEAIPRVSPKFRASVVQSNGFANAGAAWTSLETKHP